MEKQSFGSMITVLRKEKGMTQLELAEKMGITDKAVSKWERDLSFPDVSSIPKLAEILGVSVDELMQVKVNTKEDTANKKIAEIIDLALKGVALAMGIAVVVLSFMNQLETDSAVEMLGIGLACLAIAQFPRKAIGSSKKTIGSFIVFLAIILCSAFYIGTTSGTNNTKNEGIITYADLTPFEKQRLEKQNELEETLCNFDKENIVEASVYLGSSGNEITYANIFIVSHEEITNKDALTLLVSESLNLDINSVFLSSIDHSK